MYLLLDIGGTKTRISFSKDLKSFSDTTIIETEKSFDLAIKKIKEAVSNVLQEGENIDAIAVGAAIVLDKEKSKIIAVSNISSDWVGESIKEKFASEFKCEKIYIENDSALAALGEAMYGSGKGFGIVAYLTVGTGVGGARVVGGKIDANAFGFEPGHQIIDFHEAKEKESDTFRGELEDYTGGRKIEQRYGIAAFSINDNKKWENIATAFAYGVNNAIVFWSPDVVVLGGTGVIKKPGISAGFVKDILKKDILKIFPVQPEIKEASLGDLGGIYGAMALIEQNK